MGLAGRTDCMAVVVPSSLRLVVGASSVADNMFDQDLMGNCYLDNNYKSLEGSTDTGIAMELLEPLV